MNRPTPSPQPYEPSTGQADRGERVPPPTAAGHAPGIAEGSDRDETGRLCGPYETRYEVRRGYGTSRRIIRP